MTLELPKTADGVPFEPGMKLYLKVKPLLAGFFNDLDLFPSQDKFEIGILDTALPENRIVVSYTNGKWWISSKGEKSVELINFYSTPEATISGEIDNIKDCRSDNWDRYTKRIEQLTELLDKTKGFNDGRKEGNKTDRKQERG